MAGSGCGHGGARGFDRAYCQCVPRGSDATYEGATQVRWDCRQSCSRYWSPKRIWRSAPRDRFCSYTASHRNCSACHRTGRRGLVHSVVKHSKSSRISRYNKYQGQHNRRQDREIRPHPRYCDPFSRPGSHSAISPGALS